MNKFDETYARIVNEMANKQSKKKVVKEQVESPENGGGQGYIADIYLMDPIQLAVNCEMSFDDFKEGLEQYVAHLEKFNATRVKHEDGMFGSDAYDLIHLEIPKGQLVDFMTGPRCAAVQDEEIGSIVYDVSECDKFPSDVTDEETALAIIKENTLDKIEEGAIKSGTGNVRSIYFDEEYLAEAENTLKEDYNDDYDAEP